MTRRRSQTEHLADFALGLEASDVPGDVLASTRLHLLDTLGCGLAAHGLGSAPYAAARCDGSSGAASAIGVAHGVSADAAALNNGILCHALDFDDTHAASVAHVTTVVAPAALAAAQVFGTSGEELMAAVLAGSEVACRVGIPAGDAFHHRGFHPTAVCGVFGATAAVGRLAGLSAGPLVDAFGIAGSTAAGLLAFLAEGTDTKPLHAGLMAQGAHTAVALAAHGAHGPATVLEGPKGLYDAFLQRPGLEADVADLGVRWETARTALKAYPACHFMHPALDAIDALLAEKRIVPGDIARMTVSLPAAGVDMVLAPLELKRRPRTSYDAKFSAPFAIGALLARGRVDLTTFGADALTDPEILAYADMVDSEVRVYPSFPRAFAGGVRVQRRDGTHVEHHVAAQRGSSENPLDLSEVMAKFERNAGFALSPSSVQELGDWALDLGPRSSLDPLKALEHAQAAEAFATWSRVQ